MRYVNIRYGRKTVIDRQQTTNFLLNNRLRPTNLFSDRRFALLLVVGCGILAMVPAFIWGIPAGADLDNHFRFVMPFYD